jgi:hypothetical protein
VGAVKDGRSPAQRTLDGDRRTRATSFPASGFDDTARLGIPVHQRMPVKVTVWTPAFVWMGEAILPWKRYGWISVGGGTSPLKA